MPFPDKCAGASLWFISRTRGVMLLLWFLLGMCQSCGACGFSGSAGLCVPQRDQTSSGEPLRFSRGAGCSKRSFARLEEMQGVPSRSLLVRVLRGEVEAQFSSIRNDAASSKSL